MTESKWAKLIEVGNQMHADLVESYLKAHGIATELVQESYERTTFGFGLLGAQILVPNFQLKEAQKLYAKSGWNFDITEIDDDEDE